MAAYSTQGFHLKRFVLVFAVLLAPGLATAQGPLAEGARIRIKQPPKVVWVGTLHALSTDSVAFVDAYGKRFSLARHNIEIERSIGRTRNFWKHFGLTIGGGAVVGGLLSAITWTECRDTGFLSCFLVPESRAEAFGYGFLAGGVVGVPVGVLLGSLVKVERWEKVSDQ